MPDMKLQDMKLPYKLVRQFHVRHFQRPLANL